jgi:hypothetical protein
MKTLRVALLLALSAVGVAGMAAAQPPSYLILRAPTVPATQHPSQSYYQGYGYFVQPRTYSYGWFGVKPHPQWSRHFGYYRNYTEWSAR